MSYKWFWLKKNSNAENFSCFIAGILISLLFFNSTNTMSWVQQAYLNRTIGENCLEIIHFLDKPFGKAQENENCLDFLYPDSNQVIEKATSIKRLGFRNFPQDIKFNKYPAKNHGYIDIPLTSDQPLTLSNLSKNRSVRISGWAILPERIQQPKLVLFSYGDNQLFFANATVKLNRPDVAKALNSNRYTQVGWEQNILLSSFPVGKSAIKAWVYDKEEKQFIKLNGEVRVEIAN